MVIMAHSGDSIRIVGPCIETFGQNKLLAFLSYAVANPWQEQRPGLAPVDIYSGLSGRRMGGMSGSFTAVTTSSRMRVSSCKWFAHGPSSKPPIPALSWSYRDADEDVRHPSRHPI